MKKSPVWSVWIEATRPKTLPAAVAPVLVGTALAAHGGSADYAAAGLCLLFALLIQIGTNFANDYYDFIQGADSASRVGPRRAVAAGLVRPEVMKRAMVAVFALAFAVGLGLMLGTLNVFFRDVNQMQAILLQFWFWLTPIVWPVAAIPLELRHWLSLNPLEPMVAAMHSLFLGTGSLDPMGIFRGLLFSIFTLWLGYAMFRSKAAEFADEL